MTGPSVTSTAFVLSLFDTGLAAVQSLGRVGIPVIGLDSNPRMPGFKSRYCTPWMGEFRPWGWVHTHKILS